ncbi:putative membrane protein [Mycolicibacterium chubuense NBB4]|uniref:Putative membrane protein n=1 Tax=Mycolicibacterium chubuense (strain NBB4) TaxID=710421 RepID=I4BQQ5_MYCCN|nr:FUSC family protein [Mycolicibacterium chubuense]AFM19612.1 putative membrane protein [Mycolicibacterium chubuense NBB4]
MRGLRRLLERAVARVTASDPSHQRLRMAARGTLAVACSVGTIALLSQLFDKPVLPAAPGLIVAMIGTMAVNDDSLRGRMVTLALGVLTALAGVAAGSLLFGSSFASHVVFVVAAGAATYAQRYAPRGTALGMLGFMSYFMAIFLRVPFSSLAWTAVAIGCGAVIAGVVKEVLVPDRPVGDLRRTIDAFTTRLAQVCRAAAVIARDGDDGIDGRRRARLRRRVLALRETELAIDSQLGGSQADASVQIHDLVLHATLAAEALGEQSVHGADSAALAEQRTELAGIVAELTRAGRQARPDEGVPESADDDTPDADGEDDDGPRMWPSPDSRKALQAIVATGLAVPLGLLVSTQRWYWAAIGAFVVFTRPATAEESVVRGFERLLGTTVGAAAGIALGTAVSGHATAQLTLLAVGVFVSLYLFGVSYAFAMAGITAILAIIYDLMGQFSDRVLELRVVETAIGVALGGLAAIVVFPMSSRRKIREAEDDLLAALQDFLDALAAPEKPRAAYAVRDDARNVEQKAHDLRLAAEPLTEPFPGLGSGRRRQRVIMLTVLGRSARQLAREVTADPAVIDSREVQEDIAALSRRLQAARSSDDGAARSAVRTPRSEGPIGRELQRIARVLDSLDDASVEDVSPGERHSRTTTGPRAS